MKNLLYKDWVRAGLWYFLLIVNGHICYWNEGLQNGLGNFLLASLVISVSYLCLVMSLSEMVSAMPFSGGIYAIVRVMVGFYAGFITGAWQVILYAIVSAYIIHDMIKNILEILSISQLQTLFVSLFYFAVIGWYHARKHSKETTFQLIYSNLYIFVGIFAMVLLVIYFCSAIPHVNIEKYGPYRLANESDGSDWFVRSEKGFFNSLSSVLWFYIGLESLPYYCIFMSKPKKDMPMVFRTIFGLTVLLGLIMTLFSSSLPSGLFYQSHSHYPIYSAFYLSLHLSRKGMEFLVFIIHIGSAVGFVQSYNCIMKVMDKANLFPKGTSVISKIKQYTKVSISSRPTSMKKIKVTPAKDPKNAINTNNAIKSPTNVAAMDTAISTPMPDDMMKPYSSKPDTGTPSIINIFIPMSFTAHLSSMMICLCLSLIPSIKHSLRQLILFVEAFICMMIAVSYIYMKSKHEKLERAYKSPLGNIGAYICVGISMMTMVSISLLETESYSVILTFLIASAMMTVYYFCFAVRRQVLSDDELRITFTTLVVKFNLRATNNANQRKQTAKFKAAGSTRVNKISGKRGSIPNDGTVSCSQKPILSPTAEIKQPKKNIHQPSQEQLDSIAQAIAKLNIKSMQVKTMPAIQQETAANNQETACIGI